ncbi:MAG: lysine--tRNA ligase [Parcubacteria group bacterium CG11_big_fil_rev_8_21_14_0_20_39_14]|nr:MAG: lysine--tRNA ligase [Parcubacteria group bacterium CG11_big_fil_rev_8_21_14_0_20_39_14]PIS35043.1 MAG: lysine--tRNA ligase [Parcubacteria group bacterium CG08_land_8_20_14_0_20_38_56]
MALDEIKNTRFEKLKAIQKTGVNPYPQSTKRTQKIEDALKDFSKLSKSEKEVILAGRIMSKREHGGSTFCHIKDDSGQVQVYSKKDRLGEKSYQIFLNNFDIGDFIEARGILFKTKRGEKTLLVSDFKMLAKSLLPLPEKWHGLQDVEERFRKRYLDLMTNEEVYQKFELRSKIIAEIRNYLEKEEFLEVETPILQLLPGGARAKPFKTHLNALGLDLYLRVAPELYLKRLLIGGFEKVYEIGRCFRNEGMDWAHNPDFTMLELYWAYKDYKDLMKFIERMFGSLIKKVFGNQIIKYEGRKIDFKTPWQRIEFSSLIQKYTKIRIEDLSRDYLAKKAGVFGLEIEKNENKGKIADEIFKKVCLPKIWQPTFVIHHPLELSPLAKALDNNYFLAARFQLIAAGWELVNGFSELNDAFEQRKRFEEEERERTGGDEEAQRFDRDFIEALEYGMPPAAGLGIGIDRLVALLTDSHSLREVILFPIMRPR